MKSFIQRAFAAGVVGIYGATLYLRIINNGWSTLLWEVGIAFVSLLHIGLGRNFDADSFRDSVWKGGPRYLTLMESKWNPLGWLEPFDKREGRFQSIFIWLEVITFLILGGIILTAISPIAIVAALVDLAEQMYQKQQSKRRRS